MLPDVVNMAGKANIAAEHIAEAEDLVGWGSGGVRLHRRDCERVHDCEKLCLLHARLFATFYFPPPAPNEFPDADAAGPAGRTFVLAHPLLTRPPATRAARCASTSRFMSCGSRSRRRSSRALVPVPPSLHPSRSSPFVMCSAARAPIMRSGRCSMPTTPPCTLPRRSSAPRRLGAAQGPCSSSCPRCVGRSGP